MISTATTAPGAAELPSDADLARVAREWRGVAARFAAWTLGRWVNRTDVWGGYIPPDRRQARARADGTTAVQNSYTAPAKARRGLVRLDEPLLARHYRGGDVGHLIGLHTTSADNTSLFACAEVDCHGGRGDPAANLAAALHWYERLIELGFDPDLTESNGVGGYHLKVTFCRAAPTADVHHFLRWLTADYARHGLAAPPEVFPKQPRVEPGHYGNWLRLPGRHHTRNHWTRRWGPGRWVGGAECAELIMLNPGDDPDLIPAESRPKPPPLVVANASDRQRLIVVNANAGEGVRMTDTEVAPRCLPHLDPDDYDAWVTVGMALHWVDAGGAMLAEWDAWSRRSGKYAAGECGRKWATFHAQRDRRVHVGYLVKLARNAGFEVYPATKKGGGR